MSYVLEALKKAQAQREQGAVPGIHSTQVPYVAVDGKPRSNPKPLLWSIAALLGVIAALLAWRSLSLGGQTGEGVPTASSVPAPRVAAPVVVAPPVAVSSSAAPALLPPPSPVPVSESLAKGEVQVPTATRKKLPPSRAEPKAEAKVEAKAKVPSNVPRIYAMSELPEDVRRALPTLVISGGSYSASPAQRLIIVNNQVFTESSQLAPGVVVEKIEPNAAVLSFRGYAYRVAY